MTFPLVEGVYSHQKGGGTVKINEVEALVGITKKNIRFYEEQGLLKPGRNAENGYREYGNEEVELLQRIKLLRKLGVPIEDIRQMLSGAHTVGDGMRRHLVTLERERRNVEQAMQLCTQMQNMELPIRELDAQQILNQMEEMERGGTSFSNKQEADVRVRYMAPVTVTVLLVIFLTAMSAFLLWAYRTAPQSAPPVWFIALILGIFLFIGGGAVLALMQRIGEIRKGEIDDAKNY